MDASNMFARNFFNVTYEDLPSKVVEETKKQVCRNCGAPLRPGAVFCENCGQRV